MIVRDKRLKIPHGNTIIWRYLGLDKFLDLIVSRELYFANAATMTDQYEGVIPKRTQKARKKNLIQRGLPTERASFAIEKENHLAKGLKDLTLLNC